MSDRILVEIIPEEDKQGSLYVAPNPHTQRVNNYYKGKVIATGNGRMINNKVIKMNVKVGDVVMYPVGSYLTERDYEKGKLYHYLFETDIWAILEGDK